MCGAAALGPSMPACESGHLTGTCAAAACPPVFCLQMQPHLFREAVETAFQRIKEAREEDEAAEKAQVCGGGGDGSSLVAGSCLNNVPLCNVFTKLPCLPRRVHEHVCHSAK